MCPQFRLIANRPCLISLFALLVGAIALSGCGSRSAQLDAALPPAIPASEPVLLYTGVGTSSSDVAALETILGNLSVGYTAADSVQLNAMSEAQLAGYKLIIVP